MRRPTDAVRVQFGMLTLYRGTRIAMAAAILGSGLLVAAGTAFAGSASLSWDANTETDLAGYRVHYGTTSGSYTTSVDAGLVTSYTVNGLGSGTYYFAVTAYNTSGDQSGYSNEGVKTVTDTVPPVVSAIASGSLTSTGASITWTTDEAATSLVEYGTTTGYGSSSSLEASLVTAHTRALTGLAPSTTYHYRVKSTDAAGNTATSGDNTFATTAAPDTTAPVISGIAFSAVTTTGATITWTTDEASTTLVQYGTTTAYGSSTTQNNTLVTAHTQSLTGLQPQTLYHFRVRSQDAAGNLATSSDATFTTVAAPDTTAPTISGITASNVSMTSAIITWATNEAATSLAEYGTSTAYGSSSAVNTTLVTSHSRTLSGLAASTTYHYRVTSVDGSGNTATSSDGTFTTSAVPDTTPPVISGISAGSITATSVQITWTTNEAGTSLVQYSTNLSFNLSSALNSTPVTNHSRTLTGLTAATQYNYRVVTTDSAGNAATSGTNTFTTAAAPDTAGPQIRSIAVTQITSSSATVTWTTDEPATSLVQYGLTAAYGLALPLNATLTTSHSRALTGLTPATTYHFQVRNSDAAGNASLSSDQVLTTLAGSDTTPPGDVENFSARGENRQVTLNWTNPPDADFTGVRIRFRTDRFPINSTDGQLLGDFTGSQNERVSALHESLVNGVTYYYSASSYDSRGNFQSTANASATPSDPASSNGDTQITIPTGGCGMVIPPGGGSAGPGQAADMIAVLTLILLMGIKQGVRAFRHADQGAATA